MIEELRKSNNTLKAALQEYFDICSTVASYYESGNAFDTISQSIVENITTELDFIASCEINIKQTKKMLYRARNSCSAIVPIHVLPFEIMSYIFQLVVDSQLCRSSRLTLKSPKGLSHVCSRWRQIALGSPQLWSHIDLVPFHFPNRVQRFLARGQAFAARASHLPLSVHIFGEQSRKRCYGVDIDLNTFCASVSTRIEALAVDAGYDDYIYPPTLGSCFAHCVPGTLKELAMVGYLGESKCHFIETAEHLEPINGALNISRQHLEDLLFPIKVLHLSKLYFPWTSKAYHGLVDLELTFPLASGSPKVSMSQLQLARILAASPGLRHFRFHIKITDSGLYSPTMLNDLEILSLHALDCAQYKILLRTISPGSKPLQMSIYLPEEALPLLCSAEFASFMVHSNMVQLYMRCTDGRPVFLGLPQLLAVTPGLKTLLLARFELPNNSDHPLDYDALKGEITEFRPKGSQLDCLKFIGSCISMNELLRVTEMFPIQELELWDCGTCIEGRVSKCDLDELAKIFPAVKSIDGLPSISAIHRAPWDQFSH